MPGTAPRAVPESPGVEEAAGHAAAQCLLSILYSRELRRAQRVTETQKQPTAPSKLQGRNSS